MVNCNCCVVTYFLYNLLRLRRFTEDHTRVSESGTENISSSNRPSALERNYQQFYDHERMDAIECIESSRIQKDQSIWAGIYDQRVACIIFEVSQYSAKPHTFKFYS